LQLPKPSTQLDEQTPPLQTLDATFCVPHGRVQLPQRAESVMRLISQPLDATASQLANPVLHPATWHEPVAQVAVAFGRLQAVPQEPQFVRVATSVSQPLTTLLSQLPHPVAHVGVHTPDRHWVVPWGLAHATPQAPQLAVVFNGSSHPFASVPSQLPQPALQVWIWQAPDEHVAVAWARLHAVPHAPQLLVVLSGASHPFASLPSQLPQPV
jgi:hypothetical protein